ncbi:chondroitin sulfate synthase 1-like [Branchiostoma floridae]|uniref:Hexosyltransferase n=1 Tax=Branchiostoma floridae TaxID=7739 RepID=A0A9J7LYX2_BRAFL|nr:chondroitin sulfate synthase 1-like [Branchiostoma floridae]
MASLRGLTRTRPGMSLFAGVLLGFFLSNWLVIISDMTLPLLQDASCVDNDMWSREGTDTRENEVQDFQREKRARVDQRKGNHVYVGVMTAEKYLNTRAVAAFETWVRSIRGRVEFFTGGHAGNRHGGVVPTVFLRGVTDVYPPQKKSFLMLKYMHDHYLDEYEWFVRADDDVYIQGGKLEQFLRGVNSSQPLYIGQPGFGKQGEFGQLGFAADENFCMGGPGMIMSRETLRRVVPNISWCLKNLYSAHEDVEVGRCIGRFAQVSCTWSYEAKDIFYHDKTDNVEGFMKTMGMSKLRKAITLHPNKNPSHQYRLHKNLLALQTQDFRHRTLVLHREIRRVTYLLGEQPSRLYEATGRSPSLLNFVPKDINSVMPWDFITNRQMFTADISLPAKAIPMALSTGLGHVVEQLKAMELINKNARRDRRTAYYREIYYGYRRVNPMCGTECVLDLLLDLVSHEYIGENSTLEVRKHAYLQQSFSQIVFEEHEIDREDDGDDDTKRGLGQNINETHHVHEADKFKRRTERSRQKETIHAIVPVAGRLQAFRRFMKSYERSCLKTGENVRLLVILFKGAYKQPDQTAAIWKLVISYSMKYPDAYLKILPADRKFSKGLALGFGASVFTNTSLLFFCDVDLVFRPEFLERCRWNTIHGHQAYFPVAFSQYDPVTIIGNKPTQRSTTAHRNPPNPLVGGQGNDVVNQSASRQSPHQMIISSSGRLSNKTMTTTRLSRPRHSQVSDFPSSEESMMHHYVFSKDAGYWRYYGFGMVCLYQSDFLRTDGFDPTIEGWGLEDVDLYEKFVKKDIRVMRVVDPGMVHVFHTIHCDPALSEKQYRMCLGARANTYGSAARLGRVWRKMRQKRNTT